MTTSAKLSGRCRQVLAEIERRNLKLEDYGTSYRVFGPGVDILTKRLDLIHLDELEPRARTRNRE